MRETERERVQRERRVPQRDPSIAPARERLGHAHIVALQRSAGNAAVTSMLLRESTPLLPPLPQRNPNMSYPGDDPLGPMPTAPKPLEPAEREFFAELRGKTRFRAGLCFTKYVDAANDVKKAHEETDSSPGFLLQLIELAVGALAPGLVGFALAPLRNELKSIASVAVERFVKDADKQVARYLTADAMIDKYLADEAGAGQVTAALKAAWGKSNVNPKLPVGPMLDGFVQEFSEYLDGISDKLASLSPAEQVGAYAAFDPRKATKHFYKLQIEDLLMQHQSLARVAEGAPKPGFFNGYEQLAGDRQKIVMLQAYGVNRPAVISLDRDRNYVFTHWVWEESTDTAVQLGKGQETGLERVAAPEQFEPRRHRARVYGVTAPSAGEQYAEVVVRGRPHIAKVTLNIAGAPEAFGSWVDPSDEHFARAKGERQYAGLKRLDAARFGTLPDPPLSPRARDESE